MADSVILSYPQAATPKRIKRKRRKRLSQIADWQDLLLKGAQTHEPELSASAAACNAWANIEKLRRDMLGLGKPKPVEPVNASKTRKPKSAIPL